MTSDCRCRLNRTLIDIFFTVMTEVEHMKKISTKVLGAWMSSSEYFSWEESVFQKILLLTEFHQASYDDRLHPNGSVTKMNKPKRKM